LSYVTLYVYNMRHINLRASNCIVSRVSQPACALCVFVRVRVYVPFHKGARVSDY
jgi:hypothetical protein